MPDKHCRLRPRVGVRSPISDRRSSCRPFRQRKNLSSAPNIPSPKVHCGSPIPASTVREKEKHIVLIAADQEYRSEEALPMLAKMLAKRHGFDCTVLFSVKRKQTKVDPTRKNPLGRQKRSRTTSQAWSISTRPTLVILFSRLISLPEKTTAAFFTSTSTREKPIIGNSHGEPRFF